MFKVCHLNKGVDCIYLAQDRAHWWALLNMVMKLEFHKRLGDFLLAELLLASQAGLCCME
jgi:hypothetical protein